MENDINWNSNYSVGHQLMDDQHKWLFGILRRLKQNEVQTNKELLIASIDELLHYSREHFSSEEALMESVGFPGLDAHKLLHEKFNTQILELKNSIMEKELGLIQNEMVDFLSNWLIKHIQEQDKKYEDFIKANNYQKKLNEKPAIIITGASGLIGSHLVNYLCLHYHIIGISRIKRESTFLITWYQCDIESEDQVINCFKEINENEKNLLGIIHLAAHIDFQDRPSSKWNDVNILGTKYLLEQSINLNLKFFLHTSSIVVMGSAKEMTFLNEESDCDSIMNYGQSKIEAEKIIEKYKQKIKTITIRLSTVYATTPHSSFLNFQVGNCYNQSILDRFLPSLIGGVAYVNVVDVCNAFSSIIDKINSLESGEKLIISESGYLPHICLFRIISGEINHSAPAIFPVNKTLARVGAKVIDSITFWDKNKKIKIKPWMADLATVPYCFDISKSYKQLGWKPNFHISSHLKLLSQDLLVSPESWLKQRGLNDSLPFILRINKIILIIWDLFFGPAIKDLTKLILSLRTNNKSTLIESSEMIDKYLSDKSEKLDNNFHFNLHALEISFNIPWRIAQKSFYKSWPSSLVKIKRLAKGFEYSLLNKFCILRFEITNQKENSIEFKVTKGFAKGASTSFSIKKIDNKNFLFIETKVSKKLSFPKKVHNQYIYKHLINISQNVFAEKLQEGEFY